MLGEDHSLLKEFPEYKDAILALVETNEDFALMMRNYNSLDKEIRTLELRDSPISDGEMHQMKHDRAEMKDALHSWAKSF
ncbi:YdcH family protein [Vibrio europaeus]|uniref:YdcH family protein n=1 Tax=Vibrio europaeus TaxID=300876 RepID=A0A178J759_9VIBR|nr:YdcH family protein [Vibrio europaeus]MDC5705431.1 YdcH family protein [Vibrio europaeus]MDC5710710.1 YdcH family protein [Vibrio europaeus]MDC5715800.1 YdcH family protein [Vibrio europaeus]MDC5719961.1 YdcH family protein [Vibrio europaeus]MDC5724152.1 YdcH family protein [Vibrio europaeus]